MNFQELLKKFCKLLQRGKIRYLLTGGLATGFYGFPRTTHDIDFIVEVERESIYKLHTVLANLGRSYLVSVDQLTEHIQQTPILVTAFHFKSGIKIDFWIIEREHFVIELKRRSERTFLGQKIVLVSPEDLILTKLSWCKELRSERHMGDCVGIWCVQKGRLDEDYLKKRASELGVTGLLAEISTGSLPET